MMRTMHLEIVRTMIRKVKKTTDGDTIFVDSLVWEDIDDDLVMPYISNHYCVPHGFKEGMDKLFQTFIGFIMLTSGMLLEHF